MYVRESVDVARQGMQDYLEEISRMDIQQVSGVSHDPIRVKALLNDMEALGLLFENLVLRDLRIYTQGVGAHLSQYRDSNGLEADIIIEAFGGKWAAIEVKLGVNRIDEGAASLLRLAGEVDTSKMGKPSFLAVVTATGYAYKRQDGVFVLTIGSLKP